MTHQSNEPRDEVRRLAAELLEYAIYAPLGAAVVVAEELPELVRRGRERFGSRIALAQVLGRVAADSARRRAGDFVRHPATDRAPAGRDRPAAHPEESAPAPHLPLSDYDSLSAAEVISRLAGLNPHDLREVRSYETAHRARRTVLNRIAQLLGDWGQ